MYEESTKPSELPKGTVIQINNTNAMYFKYSPGCWVEMFWDKDNGLYPHDEKEGPDHILDNEDSWKMWMAHAHIESADSDAYFKDEFKVTSMPIRGGHQE